MLLLSSAQACSVMSIVMTVKTPVYLDNHSTTAVDPRVVEVMLPFFTQQFGNAGSSSHAYGWEAKDAVDRARQQVAQAIGAKAREVIFTSGATESNNLAVRGIADWLGKKGRHLLSVVSEHRATLDPLDRLTRRGYEVTLLPVHPHGHASTGQICLNRFADAIRDDTILVSVMLANNEIGVIQPLAQISEICRERDVILHCDATQAIGKMPVDVTELGIDLMSFSAHKLYGPKGVGALYVRGRSPQTRLVPLFDGGGQERGVRSGTLNVHGIVGFGAATELAIQEMNPERTRVSQLRDRLFQGIQAAVTECTLNGPLIIPGSDTTHSRLAGNLNMTFRLVEGESLMMSMGDLAVSSGSACTSANPEPSHVLRALGLPDDDVRASLRFGVGRFNTEQEIDFAIETLAGAVKRLRALSSMA